MARSRHVRGLAFGDFVGGERQARAVVPPRRTGPFGGFALRRQLLRRAVAVIPAMCGDQRANELNVPVPALGLKVRSIRTTDERAFVPVEPQPAKAVQNS